MKIGITGCKGRMGSMLVQEIKSGAVPGVTLAGGTVLPEDMGKADFFVTTNPEELFDQSDVIIDFTVPEATRKHVWLSAKRHKSIIIGTTGLSAADEKELHDAANETRIVYAANFSVGVNVLLSLAEKAASALGPEWDIEIDEAHHKHKIDAPSGTALAIGKAVAKGRKTGPESFAINRTGSRKSGSIGFSVRRGGDVVGEHTAFFYADGERIALNHTATNRALFARGAIRAALWTRDKKDGLYSMRDVLSL